MRSSRLIESEIVFDNFNFWVMISCKINTIWNKDTLEKNVIVLKYWS